MLSVSGCRGIIGTSLTPDVAARFTSALVTLLTMPARAGGRAAARPSNPPRINRSAPPRVVLARDGRRGSDLFAGVARTALLARGVDVLDLDIAMTPSVGVCVDRLGASAGLVITASHNPQPWCGLKPILRDRRAAPLAVDAAAPAPETARRLVGLYHQTGAPAVGTWDTLGHARVDPAAADVHDRALREALGGPTLRRIAALRAAVVVDNLGMSGAALADRALRALCPFSAGRITQLHPASAELPDPAARGLFPHAAEPLRENLTALARAVRARRADVGFAQDPDADRLAVIDHRGRYVGEESTLVLAALALRAMKRLGRGDTLVVNLSTSRMIEDVAGAFGARVLRAPVGEANVVAVMKRADAALGGEGNGGVIWPRVTYIRDSLSAMALVLALMAIERRSLTDLLAGVPAYAIVKRKIEVGSRDQAADAVEKVARFYAARPGAGPAPRIDRQDGVWVGFDDRRAWLHVRASNTEPIMRLIAEAPTARAAEGLIAEAAGVIG
jgi:phosphomannomutase